MESKRLWLEKYRIKWKDVEKEMRRIPPTKDTWYTAKWPERCQFLFFRMYVAIEKIHYTLYSNAKTSKLFFSLPLFISQVTSKCGKKWLNSHRPEKFMVKERNTGKTYHRWFDFRMVWSVCDAARTSNFSLSLSFDLLSSYGIFCFCHP